MQKMPRPLGVAFVAKLPFTTRLSFLSVCLGLFSCSAVQAQGLTMEEMLRMTGGSEPHLRALQNSYSTQVNSVQSYNQPVQNAFAGNAGIGSGYDIDAVYNERGSSGAYGEPGNSTSNQYYYAQQNRNQYDYEGSTRNQRPISRGGLPETTTAIQSQAGSFGKRFGATEISPGKFTYGFSPARKQYYTGVSGNRYMRGNPLPPVSTASVDIDIVDH